MFTQKNVLEMARALGTLLGEACNARDELNDVREALKDFLATLDGERATITVYADPGCSFCTEGTTPDRFNTGICDYHILKRFADKECN